MKTFIRNNLVLLAGVVLPLLLVCGFLVLAQLPRALVDPPGYDFLVVGYRHDYQQQRKFYLDFDVRKGELIGRIIPRDDSGAYNAREYASLYRYRAVDNRFDEISYQLPEGAATLDSPITFPVAETAGLTLDNQGRSPDGFTFEYLGYPGNGGLLGALFGMERKHGSEYVLRKDSAVFDLPPPVPPSEHYYGTDLVFLGWVDTGETP